MEMNMKCNLMAWLRKENEDIPAFPIGAPFRPKEVKPVESVSESLARAIQAVATYDLTKDLSPLGNPSLFVYGTTKPKEFYASDVKWENEPNPVVIDSTIKPQSAWRTGKPEADGVYKVLSVHDKDLGYFSKFENTLWYAISMDKEIAQTRDDETYFQDRKWKPIEE